jgi:integrase/recombinase XerD
MDGVEGLHSLSDEELMPPLCNTQARQLWNTLPADTLKGKRDRAIIFTLAHHALQRAELCNLKVKDIQQRRGMVHLRFHDKRGKIRFISMHSEKQRVINKYLNTAGYGKDVAGPLFRSVKNNTTGKLRKVIDPRSVLRDVVVHYYAQETGLAEEVQGLCTHLLRNGGNEHARSWGRYRRGSGVTQACVQLPTLKTIDSDDPRKGRRSVCGFENVAHYLSKTCDGRP